MPQPEGLAPGQALIDLSQAHEARGDIAAALQAAAQALDLARQNNDPAAIAAAAARQAFVEFRLGHYPRARQLAEQVIAAAPPASLAHIQAVLILGNVAAETNSLVEAEACYHRVIDLSRSFGQPLQRLRALHNLATGIYFPRGKFALALQTAQEAGRLAAAAGYPDHQPYALTTQAWIHQITGQAAAARQTLDELAALARPGSLNEGYHHYLSGLMALDEEQPEAAQPAFHRARSIAEDIGEPGLNILARLGMAQACRQAGSYPAARLWAEDAQGVAEAVGYQHDLGMALTELGRIAWLEGRLEAAQGYLRQAVELLQRLAADYGLAQARLLLAAALHSAAPRHSGRARSADARQPAWLAAWQAACHDILLGGYDFLLRGEQRLVCPLLAAALASSNPETRRTAGRVAEIIAQAAPPLRVVLLGGFEVWQGRRRVPPAALNRRKAGELLALLLISPGRRLAADQIAEALWPDRPPASLPQLLHHATHSLRQALEAELPARLPSRYLEFDEGQVLLRLPPGSQVDLEDFEALCRRRQWQAALSAYTGELLPPYLYADWSALPRQQALRLLKQSLHSLAELRLEQGCAAEALELAQRLLDLDPWEERAVLAGMRACQQLNAPALGLRLYRELERTLRAELGVEPQASLQDLARALGRARRSPHAAR